MIKTNDERFRKNKKFNVLLCRMLSKPQIIKQLLQKKAAIIIVLLGSTLGAFGTLGDGKGKPRQKSLLTKAPVFLNTGTFSLKSTYDFRGNHIINEEKNNYLFINTTLTYKKGNTTYIVPIKRKVILDKIKFNPASKGNY